MGILVSHQSNVGYDTIGPPLDAHNELEDVLIVFPREQQYNRDDCYQDPEQATSWATGRRSRRPFASRYSMTILLLVVALIALTMLLVTCMPMMRFLDTVYKAHGTVTDAETGVPLVSVEVFISTYQYSELTNSQGDYELELREGTWTLDFIKDGYEPLSKEVTVDETNQRVRVDAALTPIGPGVIWLVGFWAMEPASLPSSPIVVFNADGTWGYFENYFGTGDPLMSGEWTYEDGSFYQDGILMTIEKVDDDTWIYVDIGATLYRKGTEPFGYAFQPFDQTPAILTPGTWSGEGITLEMFEMKLYSFTAPSAASYYFWWDDSKAPGAYTANVEVSAYQDDKKTEIFKGELGWWETHTAEMAAGETIYLVVYAFWGGGTYRIIGTTQSSPSP